MDDGSIDTAPVAPKNPSQIDVYGGSKQAAGNPVERAGLTNGRLCGHGQLLTMYVDPRIGRA